MSNLSDNIRNLRGRQLASAWLHGTEAKQESPRSSLLSSVRVSMQVVGENERPRSVQNLKYEMPGTLPPKDGKTLLSRSITHSPSGIGLVQEREIAQVKNQKASEVESYKVLDDEVVEDIQRRENKFKDDQQVWRKDLPPREADVKIRQAREGIEATKKQYITYYKAENKRSGYDAASGSRFVEALIRMDVYIPEVYRGCDTGDKNALNRGFQAMMNSSDPEIKEKAFMYISDIVTQDKDLDLMSMNFNQLVSTYDNYMTQLRPLEEVNRQILELKKQRSSLEKVLDADPDNVEAQNALNAVNQQKQILDAHMGEMEGELFHASNVIQSISNMFASLVDSGSAFTPGQRSQLGFAILGQARAGSDMAINLLMMGKDQWNNRQIKELLASRGK